MLDCVFNVPNSANQRPSSKLNLFFLCTTFKSHTPRRKVETEKLSLGKILSMGLNTSGCRPTLIARQC